MSDHDERIPTIIATAIAAAGPKRGRESQWRNDVTEMIGPVVEMLTDTGSRQWEQAEMMLHAKVFPAIYLGYEIEESSTRCLVQIQTQPSKRYPDGIEPIRSHRTDDPRGIAMKARLDALKPGCRVLVWKYMDSINDDTKVRLLVHVKWLGSPDRPAGPPSPQRDGGGDAGAGPSPPAPPAPTDTERTVVDAINDLDNRTKVAVMRRVAADGLHPDNPDHEPKIYQIIDELVAR